MRDPFDTDRVLGYLAVALFAGAVIGIGQLGKWLWHWFFG